MKTDDLIEALSAGTAPARAAGLERGLWLWSAAAVAAAFAGVWFYLHLRPDLMQAMGGVTFWMKASYTAALALTGGWLFARLGRPGASARAPFLALAAIAAVALSMGGMNLMMAPEGERMHVLLGHSWRECTLNVAGLSVLTAPFLFWAARKFAPTRPTLAGAAAGLTAGAIAATLYGLYCQESAAAFVAVWYSLGVLAAAVAGAVIGRFLLRW